MKHLEIDEFEDGWRFTEENLGERFVEGKVEISRMSWDMMRNKIMQWIIEVDIKEAREYLEKIRRGEARE